MESAVSLPNFRSAFPNVLPLSRQRTTAEFACGDNLAVYSLDVGSGQVEFLLVPSSKRSAMVRHRRFLEGPEIATLPASVRPIPARRGKISLVQVKLAEDDFCGGFAAGRSMRHNQTVQGLQFVDQWVEDTGAGFVVKTTLKGQRDFICVHVLQYETGMQAVKIDVEFINVGSDNLTLEMLSSAVIGGLSPFDTADAVGRLRLHRFRSSWSAEGRHEAVDLEDLHLERSWMSASVVSERFGQVGSMPVRGWFPCVAVEDKLANVTWAIQLMAPGSWQIEIYRIDDCVSLSGGQADREFGHWCKKIEPGESFRTMPAFATSGCGDIDNVCQRLVRMQEIPLKSLPPIEDDLPVVFNEWCSSWGMPTPDFVIKTADRLSQLPVKIFVIDDGWAEKPDGAGQHNGDWNVDESRFPGGLAPVAAALREKGFVPGLWFEFEVCTEGTCAFDLQEHKLRRDGRTLRIGSRHFWDFTDPWTFAYLRDKLISRLKNDGFGYLKVDYNDTVGIGCDHPESLGEGLRQHLEGVQNFFRELRQELPGLIIENCSSGGHRLEPSFMALSAMASFSDAHECLEIPIIAANLHRLILPRQNQIWAVLHASDTLQRLQYSLAATFLGRVCLSGEITSLSSDQFDLLRKNLAFYQRVKHLIRDGESKIFRDMGKSWRDPRGWQILTRSGGSREILAVLHAFGGCAGRTIRVPLPEERQWELVESCMEHFEPIPSSAIDFVVQNDFSAGVVHYRERF